jgi:glycosyltransferase involved in cell wall biosynthesis
LNINSNKIGLLGNGTICGIDFDKFQFKSNVRNLIRKRLGLPNTACVCIYLGRLHCDKGLLDLVNAFIIASKANKMLYLLIVGPDEDDIIVKIKKLLPCKLNKHLVFVGFANNPEVYLNAADFLCLPSYREGFGMVILEAAALGIPSIGSNIPGINDAIIHNKTGILFNPKDIINLSENITLLASNKILFRKLGLNAKKRCHSLYRSDFIIDLYARYFRSLVN